MGKIINRNTVDKQFEKTLQSDKSCPSISTKQCSRCYKWLSLDNFNKDNSKKSGFRSCCTNCEVLYQIRAVYNISQSEYEDLLDDQDRLCAICQLDSVKRRFSVDHDHRCCNGRKSCGKCVRGLLCASCNSGLGFFNDDPILIIRALMYLRKYRGINN